MTKFSFFDSDVLRCIVKFSDSALKVLTLETLSKNENFIQTAGSVVANF
jgi:hypothetical protein